MKKTPRNIKAPIIILLLFLCAFCAIYFNFEKQPDISSDSNIAQQPHEAADQRKDVASEIWAKKEFLRHEMTHGMDEDDEEDEDENLYKEDFANDEMISDLDEEEFNDEVPLIKEDNFTEKQEEQSAAVIHQDESSTPLQEQEEDKKVDVSESDGLAFLDKNVAQDPVAVENKSLFSTEAQVLSVIISNDTQNESEFDPYEDAAMSDKMVVLTEEEPVKIHQSEATSQIALGKKEITTQSEVNSTQAKKEEERAKDRESRSKAYAEVASSASYLMTKFLQKTDYTKELNSIDQTKFPPEIKQVLAEMKDFAENDMMAQANNDAKIFPKEGVLDSIAGHFVQIEKVTDAKRKDEKYEQIRKKLYILEDYFYSQKFLKEIMDNR